MKNDSFFDIMNTFNRCRLGTRQKTEECNTSGVGISLAKTGKGHPFIDLVEGVLAPTNVESIAQDF